MHHRFEAKRLRQKTDVTGRRVSLITGLLVSVWVGSMPAMAHTVKTAADVAVTFHIEPDHNPKAGEPAQAWFVLTQSGGKLLPLEQCNCQLSVYSKSRTAAASPVLQPPLKATAAEQYQNVPGAEIVFPEPGLYSLELSGRPKTEAAFKPFKLSYEVTVARGKTATSSVPPSAQSSGQLSGQASPTAEPTQQRTSTTSHASHPISIVVGSIFIILGILAGVIWRSRSKN